MAWHGADTLYLGTGTRTVEARKLKYDLPLIPKQKKENRKTGMNCLNPY